MGRLRTVEVGDRSVRITTATTTTVKSSTGVLKQILIANSAAGTILVQDGAGTTRAAFKASMPAGSYPLNLLLAGAIRIVTGAASDITVTYD
jgi:UPF0716 family protein affecting phage T7 exclusion